ncbi:hypothetical protein KIJ96_06795 [Pseudoalteromonas piscicida]|nr:hypothetical protein [Pseudoalteromonas piscicida]UDM62944.1 hypothetical protein KIJ96_06795 [Pseudoalteromonas piscicida]
MLEIFSKYVLKRICIYTAERLVKRSDNKLDDQILDAVKQALGAST